MSSSRTEASAIGRKTTRSSSGAIGSTSASESPMRSGIDSVVPASEPDRRRRHERQHEIEEQGARQPVSCPAPDQRRALDRRGQHREHATRPTVPGRRPFSSEARVRAVKAAMSPKGTKMTRVTAKIRTNPGRSRT